MERIDVKCCEISRPLEPAVCSKLKAVTPFSNPETSQVDGRLENAVVECANRFFSPMYCVPTIYVDGGAIPGGSS